VDCVGVSTRTTHCLLLDHVLETGLEDIWRSEITGVCEYLSMRKLSISMATAVMPAGVVTLLGCCCGYLIYTMALCEIPLTLQSR
jgi:hypothetical protein